ncbi:DNL-type domain-containing protein [Heracleum sosnowskyi]|uniref:DNL-type domain-containing protein n=1 Tax=Heracleum sosnowskyi TaxID=360622 RepID=A0AAD8J642_9APIA|nr:DNL-type domain-containing protein [Heracleum sosnowskyi]
MAAKQLQRRLLSLFLNNQPHLPLPTDPSNRILPIASSFLGRAEFRKQGLQTLVESNNQGLEDADRNGTCNLKAGSASALSNLVDDEKSSVSYNTTSNFKISPRHDLAMMFTCKVCETRNMKTMCRESYEKGVVVARCGGCNNLHLIADHLGWFGEPGSIEEFLAARGEEVKKGSVDTLNLTLEDLAGKKS